MAETTQTQNQDGAQVSLAAVAAIKYLNRENAKFTRTPGGFVSLELDGEKFNRVGIFRAFPLDHPEEYLTVKDTENKELGIIEHLSEFDERTQDICRSELSRRYFIPIIAEIVSFKEKYGSAHIELKTDLGNIKIVVTDLSYNISIVPDTGHIFITDVSGNRYFVPEIDNMNKRSQRYLEVYL